MFSVRFSITDFSHLLSTRSGICKQPVDTLTLKRDTRENATGLSTAVIERNIMK